MSKVNLYEAKAHLGRLVKRAAAGERIMVCDRNRPVAELRAIPREERAPLKIGVLACAFSIPDDFDAPLKDFEADFYGS